MTLRTVLIVMVIWCLDATAWDANWSVEGVDGEVTVSTDGRTWIRAVPGAPLTQATWIKTGQRARAIVARGSERIVYRANTLAALSASLPAGQTTQVSQKRGAVLLSVTAGKGRQINVVTPHLAAVIKGTVLEVATDSSGSSVNVDKGLVEVQSGGQRTDVPAGRRASSSGSAITVEAAAVTSVVPGRPNALSLTPAPVASSASNAAGARSEARSTTGNTSGRSTGFSGHGNSGGNGNGNCGGSGNAGGNGNGNAGGNGNVNGRGS